MLQIEEMTFIYGKCSRSSNSGGHGYPTRNGVNIFTTKKMQTQILCLELTFLAFVIVENIFLYVFFRFVTNTYHLIFNLIQETCNALLISGYKNLKTFFTFILFNCVFVDLKLFPKKKKRYFGWPKLYV